MKIKTSQNYDLFSHIDGNRNVNPRHVANIVESMKEDELFTVITVNEKFQVIDGQHRFEALKKLGLPVNYIVCEGYGLHEVQVLNQNSKNWTAKDYMEGYIDLGYRDYEILKNLCCNYKKISISTAVFLFDNSKDSHKKFKRGEFKIKRVSDVMKIVKHLEEVEVYYEGAWRRNFVYALKNASKIEGFNIKEFVHKLSMNPSSMKDHVKIDQYLANIESVYNYRRRGGKIRLF